MPRRRANCRRCAASSLLPRPKRGDGAPAAHQGPETAAHLAAPDLAGRGDGARRGGGRGAAAAVDRRARSRGPVLLYGSGLRVAEALGLTGAVLPLGRAISVTGKRNKTRVVPCSARCARRSRIISRLPLATGRGRAACSAARAAGRCAARSSGARCARRGARSACPSDHAACPAPQLRDPSARPRRGPARASGIARPCQPVVDPDLHRGRRRASDRRLSARPSAGVKPPRILIIPRMDFVPPPRFGPVSRPDGRLGVPATGRYGRRPSSLTPGRSPFCAGSHPSKCPPG